MAVEYAIDENSNVLVVTAVGVVNVADRASLVQRLLSDSSLPDCIPILMDVSAITNFPATGDIPKLALLIKQLSARFQSKIAYFVVKPGMVTPYHLVAFSACDCRSSVWVFSNRQEANAWLTSK